MPLVLYNSLTKREEEFRPIRSGKVTIYTCGPTVYGRPHIGNYSSFIMADLLRRWLEASGYIVTHVKNITDVGHLVADRDQGEDKIEQQAKREHTDPLEIARKYTEQYLEDERALNFLEPHHRPRATETIPEMIAMTETLLRKGNAYETEDGVYFSVETFPDYGRLSGNTLENLTAGARIAVDERKRHPADFALWKKCVGANAAHVLRWNSPWGEGFPGWHIECSCMSTKFLGEEIDIHTGGEDNIFPHHESEIAQSECASGKPFVRMWLHRRRIDIGSTSSPQGVQKMSKSLGNVLTLPDITAMGYSPLDLRYYLLSVHYRTNLKFTERGLANARKARRKVVEWMGEVEDVEALKVLEDVKALKVVEDSDAWVEKFRAAMDADMNTPAALAVLFDAMAWSRSQGSLGACAEVIALASRTFGCFEGEESAIPAGVRKLADTRQAARVAGDFAASDALRDQIRAKGYMVKDTPEGQKLAKM